MIEPDFLHTTRTSYDALAVDYAEHFRDAMASKPWDRAVLAGFAELVRAGGHLRVADVGCGTGLATGLLHGFGLDVFGIDLSPGMLAVARRTHPELRFSVGSMLALDLPDAALGGLVAYYSTIHVPDERLPEVFAEFHRALAPGGHLLVAFQVGDVPLHLTEAWGRPIALDFHRRRPDHVAALLVEAGLTVEVRVEREAEPGERTPQAYLVARRPPIDPRPRRAPEQLRPAAR